MGKLWGPDTVCLHLEIEAKKGMHALVLIFVRLPCDDPENSVGSFLQEKGGK